MLILVNTIMANQRLAQTLPIYKQTYELLLLIVRARKQFFMPELDDMGADSAAAQQGLAVVYPDGAPRPRHIRHHRNVPPSGLPSAPDSCRH